MHALLTPSVHKEFTRILLDEREKITASLRARAETEHALAISQAEEGAALGAPGDVASDLADEEVDMGLAEAATMRLTAIDAALRRLAEDMFGQCERCGEQIDMRRLWALPWAARCIRCAV